MKTGQEKDLICVFDPVLSLTPRQRCTLRRAHVTSAHAHICPHTRQQDTRCHTYIHIYTTAPQGSMFSRLSVERGWLVFAQL